MNRPSSIISRLLSRLRRRSPAAPKGDPAPPAQTDDPQQLEPVDLEAGEPPDHGEARLPPEEPPQASLLREQIHALQTDPLNAEEANPHLLLRHLDSLIEAGQERLALDLLRQLTDLLPGPPCLRMARARLLFNRGQRRDALPLLDQLTTEPEFRLEAHFMLGDYHSREAALDTALQHYEAVLAIDLSHPRARRRADDLRRKLDRPGLRQAPTVLGASDLGAGSRFLLQRELGRGGGGTVYLAMDRQLGRPVAVKVLHPHVARQAGAREHLFCEARIATSLHHPRIVTIYDLDEDLNLVVMEYCAAGTLAHLLPLSPGSACGRLAEAASVLAVVHRCGVVHRDLKPTNLLLRKEGGPLVLTDFGIANAGALPGAGPGQEVAAGSLIYTAPEQRRGARADPRADLYSCGALLLEMLLGRPPLTAEQALQGVPLIHLDEVWAEFGHLAGSAPLVELARDLLQPDPEQRPADAGDLARRAMDLVRRLDEERQKEDIRNQLRAMAGPPPWSAKVRSWIQDPWS